MVTPLIQSIEISPTISEKLPWRKFWLEIHSDSIRTIPNHHCTSGTIRKLYRATKSTSGQLRRFTKRSVWCLILQRLDPLRSDSRLTRCPYVLTRNRAKWLVCPLNKKKRPLLQITSLLQIWHYLFSLGKRALRSQSLFLKNPQM